MRRKQKRLLQLVGLAVVALLFLPNVGLWSLYRDRVFDNSPDAADGPGAIPLFQVRIRLGPARLGVVFLCRGDGIYTECEFGPRSAAAAAAATAALTFPRCGCA